MNPQSKRTHALALVALSLAAATAFAPAAQGAEISDRLPWEKCLIADGPNQLCFGEDPINSNIVTTITVPHVPNYRELGELIGDLPTPDPDLSGVVSTLQEIGETDATAVLNNVLNMAGGGGITTCLPGMFLCSMAGADSHWENIGGAPDMAVMMTMGGGQSGNAFGGYSDVSTSLGSESCDFDPWAGCIRTWSDIRSKSCVATSSDVKTYSALGLGIMVPAYYEDRFCEKI